MKVTIGDAPKITEAEEGLRLALGLLEGARRDIMRAKHVLRSVGANENLTIHQVQSLVRDMDTYVFPIVRDWLSCELKKPDGGIAPSGSPDGARA